MKTILKYLVVLLTPCMLSAQNDNPTEAVNGTYYLLESERGVGNKQTFTKVAQYGKFGDDYVMAVAACEKCMPAIYKYKKEYTEELKTAVFYNDYALFLIFYDEESFIVFKPSNKEGAEFTDFSFSNFYSKSQVKVAAMSQQKIKDFVKKISE
jgi:hypothetical protein